MFFLPLGARHTRVDAAAGSTREEEPASEDDGKPACTQCARSFLVVSLAAGADVPVAIRAGLQPRDGKPHHRSTGSTPYLHAIKAAAAAASSAGTSSRRTPHLAERRRYFHRQVRSLLARPPAHVSGVRRTGGDRCWSAASRAFPRGLPLRRQQRLLSRSRAGWAETRRGCPGLTFAAGASFWLGSSPRWRFLAPPFGTESAGGKAGEACRAERRAARERVMVRRHVTPRRVWANRPRQERPCWPRSVFTPAVFGWVLVDVVRFCASSRASQPAVKKISLLPAAR
jgi:hypothetical protein